MNLKHLVSRKAVDKICRINERFLFPQLSSYRCLSTIRVPLSSNGLMGDCSLIKGYRKVDQNFMCFVRYIHSTRETKAVSLNVESKDDAEEDGNLNEFLSRFAWLMRKKICEAYPECDKPTVDGMLLVIVRKVVAEMEKGGLQHIGGGGAVSTPSEEFSEDLWKTVWDVSYSVLDDMEKERKKERMKGFLQSEDVQKMTRFAGEIGIRGDMLRELKFKWAREKMEDSEFYEGLKQIREDILAQEKEDNAEAQGEQGDVVGEEPKEVGLPKRHGKIKYKIYGLDLSDSKWAEVADKINESGEVLWPQEPKQITGKCKLVTERILSLKDEDPSPVLAEWMELLQPSRIDWMNLLDRLKEKNPQIYFKVPSFLLSSLILFMLDLERL